ncbi:MAG: restriction endonuclease subunit S [Syntrophotalea sp.]|uniref:restriction endonuclease subunit S n=1 Tax=Syntrophotalea sp. TaxID=2812029 RepID=UPI003D0C3A3D
MSFPRHEKYKDSGVEWLGEVPEGWKICRLQDLSSGQKYSFVDGPFGSDLKNNEYTESGVPLIQLNNIEVGRHIFNEDRFVSEEKANSLGKHNAFPMDIVIAKMADPVARAACVSDKYPRYVIVADCIKLSVDTSTVNTSYLVYTINAPYFRINAEGVSSGITRLRVNLGSVKKLQVAFPPLPEQRTIAAFLDHETGKIDALVAEQEKLIGLLKEKRQAVISHAVTKGLDPNARMKDSGVEWLGEVPEGWEVKRLKSLVAEPLKYGANEAAEIDDPMLPRFVRITDIDDKGGLRDETFKSLPVEVAEPYLLKEGDVLLARSGATVGKSFIYSKHWGTACFAGYLIRARLDCSYCLAQWLYYFCQTNEYWGYIVGSQIQATIQNVSAEKYANLYLPIPSTKEQRTIATFLDQETAKIDALIEEAKKAIELMKERRTALISAAVTGKIDVRDRVQDGQ